LTHFESRKVEKKESAIGEKRPTFRSTDREGRKRKVMKEYGRSISKKVVLQGNTTKDPHRPRKKESNMKVGTKGGVKKTEKRNKKNW